MLKKIAHYLLTLILCFLTSTQLASSSERPTHKHAPKYQQLITALARAPLAIYANFGHTKEQKSNRQAAANAVRLINAICAIFNDVGDKYTFLWAAHDTYALYDYIKNGPDKEADFVFEEGPSKQEIIEESRWSVARKILLPLIEGGAAVHAALNVPPKLPALAPKIPPRETAADRAHKKNRQIKEAVNAYGSLARVLENLIESENGSIKEKLITGLLIINGIAAVYDTVEACKEPKKGPRPPRNRDNDNNPSEDNNNNNNDEWEQWSEDDNSDTDTDTDSNSDSDDDKDQIPQNNDRDENQPSPPEPENNIPPKVYNTLQNITVPTDGLINGEVRECSNYCCEDFQANATITQTQCNHYYHQDCLQEWIAKCEREKVEPTCSLCKAIIA